MKHFSTLLPIELKEAGVYDGCDYYWDRHWVFNVIDFLTEQNLLIKYIYIGVKGDFGTIKGLFIDKYDWSNKIKDMSPAWPDVVRAANQYAANYVANFSWNTDDTEYSAKEPYFRFAPIQQHQNKPINTYSRVIAKNLLRQFASIEIQRSYVEAKNFWFVPSEISMWLNLEQADFTSKEWGILLPYQNKFREYFKAQRHRDMSPADLLCDQSWLELCNLAQATLDELNKLGWDKIPNENW